MFPFQHQQRQRPRAPSPLLLEETTEPSSPPLSPSTKVGQAPRLLPLPPPSPRSNHISPSREHCCSFSAVPRALPSPPPSIPENTIKAGVEGRPCSASKAHSLSPCTAHRQNRVPEPLHQEEVCTLMASQARTRGSPREVKKGVEMGGLRELSWGSGGVASPVRGHRV